jgi:hypothetical protein
VNTGAPPAPPEAHVGDDGTGLRAALAVAIRGGLLAFVATAAVAQIPALAIEVFGGGLALSTALKLGWFYELAFHRVGILVSGESGFEAHLSVAFLTGTAVVVWMLFRAGRAAGAAASASSVRSHVLAGALVGPVYALPIAVISGLVGVQLATGGTFVSGTVRFEGVVWQALVFPAVLGVVAGGAGGAMGSLPADARVRAWLIGGWRMLLTALGLAAVGVLVLAALRPEGLATYSRAVSANGPRSAALLVGHHALLLPNQSFLVIAPSMGGCTSLSGPGGAVPLLCPGTLPALDDPGLVPAVARGDVARTPAPDVPTRPMPPGYWAFLLVPAIATVGGGRWAARTWRGRSGGRERALRGAGAGVVFALLMGAGTWMASIDVGLTLNATSTPTSFTLGASPFGTASLALAWGVIGGALGAWLFGGQVEGTPVPVDPDEPVPPSPTSV